MTLPKWLRRLVDPKYRRRSAGAKRATATRKSKREAEADLERLQRENYEEARRVTGA